MAKTENPAADAILDKPFPVLGGVGEVVLQDYMGSDDAIVSAARTSYGNGTKTKREDAALIDYLIRNEHWSPVEQVVLKFRMKMPIFIARQFIRHRTARLNEVSARYSELPDNFYVPTVWRMQDTKNKQGSVAAPLNHERITKLVADHSKKSYELYQLLLNEENVAREMSRMVLPLNIGTAWVWQMDLRNLFNFLKLRLDNHAQLEAQEYAKVIGMMVQTVAPVAYESFERHVLHKPKQPQVQESKPKTTYEVVKNWLTALGG